MKKLFATLFMVVALYGNAEAQLLYRISGNGLKQTSYIIGTYHIAPASFVDDIKGAHEVLNSVEQVYGEVDLKEAAEDMTTIEAMMLPEGKTLMDMFSAEEMERINALMIKIMGVDFNNPIILSQLGRFRPSVLAMQLMMLQYMQQTPEVNLNELIDDYFQKEARKAGKRVGGLESAEFQLNLLYAPLSDEEERKELLEYVDENDKTLAHIRDLVDIYFSFDIKGIQRITEASVESGDMTTDEYNKMIRDRNSRWVENMPKIMNEGSTLFVVGAAHLPGEDGVLTLLKRDGYKVKAVK